MEYVENDFTDALIEAICEESSLLTDKKEEQTMNTDRIIWLDGHVSTIASDEASRRMYEHPTGNGWE